MRAMVVVLGAFALLVDVGCDLTSLPSGGADASAVLPPADGGGALDRQFPLADANVTFPSVVMAQDVASYTGPTDTVVTSFAYANVASGRLNLLTQSVRGAPLEDVDVVMHAPGDPNVVLLRGRTDSAGVLAVGFTYSKADGLPVVVVERELYDRVEHTLNDLEFGGAGLTLTLAPEVRTEVEVEQ
ncbi:MAG: hypothetical protein RLZZ450_3488 [Pseudomonadota bacterium]